MTANSVLSSDEIVSVLKRTCVPTLVVEGTTDAYIYRQIMNVYDSNPRISLIFCGGRNTLFKVFDRRHEFGKAMVAFVADRDSFKFTQIPETYDEVIFTTGYSIENDLYFESGCVDLLSDDEKIEFELVRKVIGVWFARAVELHLQRVESGIESSVAASNHISEVCPLGSSCICPSYVDRSDYVEPTQDSISLVFSEYDLNVRGKQLFQMLSRYLSRPGRYSQFSINNLVEIAAIKGDSPHFHVLGEKIQKKIFG